MYHANEGLSFAPRNRAASKRRGIVAYIHIATRLTALGHFAVAAKTIERAAYSLELLVKEEYK